MAWPSHIDRPQVETRGRVELRQQVPCLLQIRCELFSGESVWNSCHVTGNINDTSKCQFSVAARWTEVIIYTSTNFDASKSIEVLNWTSFLVSTSRSRRYTGKVDGANWRNLEWELNVLSKSLSSFPELKLVLLAENRRMLDFCQAAIAGSRSSRSMMVICTYNQTTKSLTYARVSLVCWLMIRISQKSKGRPLWKIVTQADHFITVGKSKIPRTATFPM